MQKISLENGLKKGVGNEVVQLQITITEQRVEERKKIKQRK